jgi:RecA-family ATPase
VVNGVIPQDAMMCLFGASQTFKSFVALSAALHICSGMDWMGLRTKQGPVVYVAAEGGGGIYRRAAAWAKTHLDQEFAPGFNICITPLNLTVEEEMTSLRMEIAEMPVPPCLIVLDTLSQLFGGGDENQATEISEFFRAVNQHLRAPFNCTVMIIHHTGYNVDAANRPRGRPAQSPTPRHASVLKVPRSITSKTSPARSRSDGSSASAAFRAQENLPYSTKSSVAAIRNQATHRRKGTVNLSSIASTRKLRSSTNHPRPAPHARTPHCM